MYARVWKVQLLPEKADQFTVGVNSVLSILRQQAGFRGLLVLRGGPGESLEATVVSAWDSLDYLRASETTAFHQAVARVLACCEHGPFMREEKVLLSEFSNPGKEDTTATYRWPAS
jgi:heme-degrading monooxygenase HmoA